MYFRKVTIDHNSIVALDKDDKGAVLSEKDAEIATAMKGILELAKIGEVNIVLPEIGASERQSKDSPINNYSDFKAKLDRLNIVPSEYSRTEFRLGVSFLGHATLGFSGPEWYTVQMEILQIVHPGFDLDDYDHKNWRNRYCDITTVLAHLMANADLLISDDKKILSPAKRKALVDLGVNQIETARDAYDLLSNKAVPKASALDLPRFDDSAEKRCVYIPPNSFHHYRAWRKQQGLPAL